MKTYADTSVLFSLYAPDANSARADAWRKLNPQPLPFSIFHRLELRNALSLAVFRKRLTPHQVQQVWSDIEADLTAGDLAVRGGLWHRVFTEAEIIAATHSSAIGSRTLDVIHIASAKISGSSEFCSFDPRQSTLAAHIGMPLAAI